MDSILSPLSLWVLSGAIFGLMVRIWRYKPRGPILHKTISVGFISTAMLWYFLPANIDKKWAFVAAYFSSQSVGYGNHIKKIKDKLTTT